MRDWRNSEGRFDKNNNIQFLYHYPDEIEEKKTTKKRNFKNKTNNLQNKWIIDYNIYMGSSPKTIFV